MADILVVDDDQGICSAFQEFLTQEGHATRVASNAADAIASVEAKHPDLVIMDIRMPGTDGLTALERIRQLAPDVYVVIMTGYGTSQTSIEALRLGAFDYLTKPLDLDVIKGVIEQALEARAAAARATGGTTDGDEPPVALVGKSAGMQAVYKLVGRVVTTDVPVLLTGERGVGKELVARTIHANSRRHAQPFVAVDCAALPEADLAEELFGRAGAPGVAELPGKLDAAAAGTLVLAGVHALTLAAQARVTRLLTERAFSRLGAHEAIAADVRVIAATDEDLADEVADGGFNAALHQALSVITIALPALRDRREDIEDLVATFVRRANTTLGRTIRGADDHALRLLREHTWPGNVAELEHVVTRACVLARGDVITAEAIAGSLLPAAAGPEETDTALAASVRKALQHRLAAEAGGDAWPPFHDVVGRVEKILVREALLATSGNQVKAAALLGLNRTTLRKKIALYNL